MTNSSYNVYQVFAVQI